jgi:hypothetical protein
MAFFIYIYITKNIISMKQFYFAFFTLFFLSHLNSQSTYVVNDLSDDPTIGSGLNGSMRYCINQANANLGLDTIKFSAFINTMPIIIDSTLKVYDELYVVGNGNTNSILRGSSLNTSGILDLYNITTGNYVVKNLKFESTFGQQSTGFAQDAGTDFDSILIEDCLFESMDYAIFLDFSKNFVTIRNCQFNSCNVGIAQQNMSKSMDVYNNNFYDSFLAAMYIQGASYHIYNNVITSTRSGSFGSMYISDPDVTGGSCVINNNTIVNNLQHGLKIDQQYGNASSIIVSNNIIYGNTPSDFIQSLASGTVVTNCVNSNNIVSTTDAASTYTPNWYSNANPTLDANQRPTNLSSNVINKSNPVTASLFDYDNISAIGIREIGAYEYNGCGTTSTITIPGSFNICSGLSDTLDLSLSITNSAGISYQWMESTSGSYSPIGTNSPTIIVSPTVNATYYCELLCEAFALNNSDTVSVTVNPLTNISGTVTTYPILPVAGTVVLYQYLPFNTKFDSLTSQVLGANGEYNFSSFASGTYIVKAIPNLNNLQITYGDSAINWKTAQQIIHGCLVNDVQNITVKALSTFTAAGTGSLSGTIYAAPSFGQRMGDFGAKPTIPGTPIGGIIVKGGKNPGGQMFVQTVTSTTPGSEGTYTLSGFPDNITNESYFILVDIPGLDTNGTYYRTITLTNNNYQGLDFVLDSVKINPIPSTAVSVLDISAVENQINVYPNPASNDVTIQYNLKTNALVKIELFDMVGKSVMLLLPETQQSMEFYKKTWQINDLSSGLYFIKMTINENESTIKFSVTQ